MVANPYYSSGENLKQKNLLAGGAAVDVPAFALSKVSLGGVASALDAGCGWGRFAVPLLRSAPALEHLVAVDVWPGMLETCRTTVADAGLSARLAAADVRHLPFPNARFDLTMARGPASLIVWLFGITALFVLLKTANCWDKKDQGDWSFKLVTCVCHAVDNSGK